MVAGSERRGPSPTACPFAAGASGSASSGVGRERVTARTPVRAQPWSPSTATTQPTTERHGRLTRTRAGYAGGTGRRRWSSEPEPATWQGGRENLDAGAWGSHMLVGYLVIVVVADLVVELVVGPVLDFDYVVPIVDPPARPTRCRLLALLLMANRQPPTATAPAMRLG